MTNIPMKMMRMIFMIIMATFSVIRGGGGIGGGTSAVVTAAASTAAGGGVAVVSTTTCVSSSSTTTLASTFPPLSATTTTTTTTTSTKNIHHNATSSISSSTSGVGSNSNSSSSSHNHHLWLYNKLIHDNNFSYYYNNNNNDNDDEDVPCDDDRGDSPGAFGCDDDHHHRVNCNSSTTTTLYKDNTNKNNKEKNDNKNNYNKYNFIDQYNDRVVLLTFSTPSIILSSSGSIGNNTSTTRPTTTTTYTYQLISPSLYWWYQLCILHVICITITSLLSLVVYQFIIQPRTTTTTTRSTTTTTTTTTPLVGKFIGYCIIIPMSIGIPYKLIQYLQFVHTNKFFSQCTSFIPTIVIFRTLEAMYGTTTSSVVSSSKSSSTSKSSSSMSSLQSMSSPLTHSSSSSSLSSSSSSSSSTAVEGVEASGAGVVSPMESSIQNYIIYYSSLTYCQWDYQTKERIPITNKQLLCHICNIFVMYNLVSVLYSILIPYNFQPLHHFLYLLLLQQDLPTAPSHKATTFLPNVNMTISSPPLSMISEAATAASSLSSSTSSTSLTSSSVLHQLHTNEFWNIFDQFDLIFDWKHLGNMYILLCFTTVLLSFLFQLNAFKDNIQGYKTHPVFGNPLFESSSPSSFWSRNWNKTLQTSLKRGIYLPSRLYFSKGISIMITFFISGVLHEYYTTLLTFHDTSSDECVNGTNGESKHRDSSSCFAPVYFKVLAFFAWNGILVLLERPLSKTRVCQALKERLPVPVISTLVLLPALPVAHWFVTDWVLGGFYLDLSMAFWTIVKID